MVSVIYIYIYIYMCVCVCVCVCVSFVFTFFFKTKLLSFSSKPKHIGGDFFGFVSFSIEVVKTCG